MATLQEMITKTDVDVLAHLDRQADIPVLTGLQRQGDVIVVPRDVSADTPVPAEGVAVVRGENGGNTHLLVGEGAVCFDACDPSPTRLVLGTLTVGEGSTAFLAHPEHGFTGIGAGCYELRRQREMADELRMVAD